MKRIICAVLCALLLLATAACSAAPVSTSEPSPADTVSPAQEPAGPDESPDAGDDGAGDTVFYTEDDPEYRELYAHNAIEEAMDQDFVDAVTMEDFDALAAKYVSAWREEYHALMDELIAAHPDDAEELQGLRDYTDQQAQEAYDATYTLYFYIDENGDEQPAAGAEQNANFDMAEVYKNATILSILNDYRGNGDYVFHYSAQ